MRRTLRVGFVAGLAVGVAMRLRRTRDLRRQASPVVSPDPWTPIPPPPARPDPVAPIAAPVPTTVAGVDQGGTGDPTWVGPVDGACPPGHLVKAKIASRIFHLPGMVAYDRTRPDRCYRSETDAAADGFTKAKR